jgi:hypothetical protein
METMQVTQTNQAQIGKNIQQSTELELFLFNIGFTSLMMDFEFAKKMAIQRDKNIQKMQLDIVNIFKRDNIFKKQNKQIQTLQLDNKALSQEIRVLNQLLKKTIDRIVLLELAKDSSPNFIDSIDLSSNTSTNTRFDRYEILTESIPVRDAPRLDARVLEYKNSGNIIKIEFCTIVGWCKLHNEWSYVLKEDLRLILQVQKSR